MVASLPNIALVAATPVASQFLGLPETVGWIVFQNESPFSVAVFLGTIGTLTIPANYLWPVDTHHPAYDGWDGRATVITPTADLAITTGSNPGSFLRIHVFRPGEPCPVTAPQPLNRSTNVGGGSVSTTTTQQLYAPDNIHYLDLQWDGVSLFNILRSHNPQMANSAGLRVQYEDSAGIFHNGYAIDSFGLFTTFGAIGGIAGEATAAASGALGVPVVDGLTSAQHVVATTQQTILSITPANTGVYRIGGYLRLNNGVSGNVLTARLSFNDPDAGGATNFNLYTINGSATSALNGVNNFPNGGYSLTPYTFRHTGGQLLTVTYTDPTNTPNDFVTITMERLA